LDCETEPTTSGRNCQMNTTEQAPKMYTNDDMLKLITTVQQIVTDLRMAYIEDDRCAHYESSL